jgi:hypothetical protein
VTRGARGFARALAAALGALALGSLGCGNGRVDGPAQSGTAGDKGTAGASAAGAAGSTATSGAAGQASTGTTGDAAGQGGAGGAGQAGAGAAGDVGAGGSTGGASGGAMGGAGAAGGGGVAGAAGTAGGAGAPPALCNGLVCEDFEKLAVGAKPGAPFAIRVSAKGTGSVLVDDTRAHSGTHSAKASITATTATDTYREAYLAVTGAPLIPLPDNHVYGRFMIYTDRIPDKSVHWTIAHGDGPYMTNTATYNYGGMGGLMANYYRDTMPPNDCWQTKNSTFPTGRWVCVSFEFDGPSNAMRFSLDGADVPEVDVMGLAKTDATCTVKGVDGRWLAPTFKNISIGWESYQNDVMGAHDAWIDDIELDTHPVTCP